VGGGVGGGVGGSAGSSVGGGMALGSAADLPFDHLETHHFVLQLRHPPLRLVLLAIRILGAINRVAAAVGARSDAAAALRSVFCEHNASALPAGAANALQDEAATALFFSGDAVLLQNATFLPRLLDTCHYRRQNNRALVHRCEPLADRAAELLFAQRMRAEEDLERESLRERRARGASSGQLGAGLGDQAAPRNPARSRRTTL